jgi:hypothetical protein
MRRTRRLTLARAAEAWPARVAAAISDLQDVDAELHAANSWLREQLQPLLEQLDGGMPWAVIDVLAAVPQARDLVGAPPCVWEVEIEGAWKRAVMLHPPAAVTVEIADSGRGRVQGLVALHPDVWDRPNVGPCRFELMVDSAVGAVRVIDPRRADHRRWVVIELAVPAGASGHVITLRTDGIGGIEHRWALWAELTYERTCA